jgi:hypothetical protein
MTKRITEALKTKPMTAKQLIQCLNVAKADQVHNALGNLKVRQAIKSVGKAIEIQSNNYQRMVDIYALDETSKPLKFKEPIKKRYYKVDLSKAKTPQRYKELLMKKNNLFMLYAKELKLTKDLL